MITFTSIERGPNGESFRAYAGGTKGTKNKYIGPWRKTNEEADSDRRRYVADKSNGLTVEQNHIVEKLNDLLLKAEYSGLLYDLSGTYIDGPETINKFVHGIRAAMIGPMPKRNK